jgi:hypothetical protein
LFDSITGDAAGGNDPQCAPPNRANRGKSKARTGWEPIAAKLDSYGNLGRKDLR